MSDPINHRFEFVHGAFDMATEDIICVGNAKYGEVSLCFKGGGNIAFAKIKLYSKNRAVDADAVFDDAMRLGKEIERRWRKGDDDGTR